MGEVVPNFLDLLTGNKYREQMLTFLRIQYENIRFDWILFSKLTYFSENLFPDWSILAVNHRFVKCNTSGSQNPALLFSLQVLSIS